MFDSKPLFRILPVEFSLRTFPGIVFPGIFHGEITLGI
jgi:hypothetical protein